MSSIQLSNEQQQQLANLHTALSGDAALRGRFQTDVRGVLAEYGLSALLPADGQFEAVLNESEVSGYAMNVTAHWDDHWNSTHADVNSFQLGSFQILPRIGTV